MSNNTSFGIDLTQLPPQAVEAEELILGGCLMEDAYPRVETLIADVFYLDSHKNIWRAVKCLSSESKPVDLVTVATWLKDRELLQSAGGVEKLQDLQAKAVTAVNIEGYAQLVKDKYIRRRLLQETRDIQRMVYDADIPTEELLEKSQTQIFKLRDLSTAEKTTMQHIDDLIVEIEKDVALSNAGEEAVPSSLSLGYADLDNKGVGLQFGILSLLLAGTGMGKTTVATDITYRAISRGVPVYFFSLEMPNIQIGKKYILRGSASGEDPDTRSQAKLNSLNLFNTNGLRGYDGEIREDLCQEYFDGVSKLRGKPLYIDEHGSPSFSYMRSQIQNVMAIEKRPPLVVVDYLQLFLKGGGRDNDQKEYQELFQITRQLNLIAKEFTLPMLCLVQSNRNADNRSNKRPIVSDIHGSSGIAREAGLILGLYRESYENKEAPDNECEINVIKNRFGPNNITAKLLCDMSHNFIANLA